MAKLILALNNNLKFFLLQYKTIAYLLRREINFVIRLFTNNSNKTSVHLNSAVTNLLWYLHRKQEVPIYLREEKIKIIL